MVFTRARLMLLGSMWNCRLPGLQIAGGMIVMRGEIEARGPGYEIELSYVDGSRRIIEANMQTIDGVIVDGGLGQVQIRGALRIGGGAVEIRRAREHSAHRNLGAVRDCEDALHGQIRRAWRGPSLDIQAPVACRR